MRRWGSSTSWSGALGFCWVPHNPSLADRNRESQVIIPVGLGLPSCANSVFLQCWLLMMRMVLPESGSVLYHWLYIWCLEGLDSCRSLPPSCYDLHFQSVEGRRPQVGYNKHIVIWRQDLGLGYDAVGQTVLPALSVDLRPGDLEACDPLVRSHPGHAPQEAAGYVSVIHGEGGRQIFWLSKNLWKH